MFLLCNSCRFPHVETAVKLHIRTISTHSQKEIKKIFWWILVLVCKLLLLVFLKNGKNFLWLLTKGKCYIFTLTLYHVSLGEPSVCLKKEREQIYYSSLLQHFIITALSFSVQISLCVSALVSISSKKKGSINLTLEWHIFFCLTILHTSKNRMAKFKWFDLRCDYTV